MRVTLKWLSKQCGLSPTAVSLILNDKAVRVSKEKKQLVLELAKKHNYIPNSNAVGLVTKKTKIVGFLIPDITNLFFAEIVKNVEQELGANDYSIILCNTNDSVKEENKYVNLLLSRGVDALIFCTANNSLSGKYIIDKFSENEIPCVAFDRYSPDMSCPVIATDDTLGAKMAVEHLLEMGHKKIGCITGPLTSGSAQRRFEGYRQAMLNAKLNVISEYIEYGDYQFESGYQKGKILLGRDISALFISNDMMAYGFYKAAQETKKNIPADISLTSFDDLLFSSMLSVPLTSVRQNTRQLSSKICEVVISQLERKIEKNTYLFEPQLIKRQSVKAL